MPTLDAEDIRWVREGGFEPGPTHAHRALFGQFEREMSSR